MMTYQITVTKSGLPLRILRIQAPSALAAIEQAEAGYKARACQMSGPGGVVINVKWTGLEFEARRV